MLLTLRRIAVSFLPCVQFPEHSLDSGKWISIRGSWHVLQDKKKRTERCPKMIKQIIPWLSIAKEGKNITKKMIPSHTHAVVHNTLLNHASGVSREQLESQGMGTGQHRCPDHCKPQGLFLRRWPKKYQEGGKWKDHSFFAPNSFAWIDLW